MTERATPFVDDLHMVGTWPVPQLGARVYDLIEYVQLGLPVDQVARLYRDGAGGVGLTERDVVVLCLHHGIGPKGGARHLPAGALRRSFLEATLPPEDRQ